MPRRPRLQSIAGLEIILDGHDTGFPAPDIRTTVARPARDRRPWREYREIGTVIGVSCRRLSPLHREVEEAKAAVAHAGANPGSSRWRLPGWSCFSPDLTADVVITDPPYEADPHTSERLVARAGGRLKREPLTFPPITEEVRTESARQMVRLARRWILVFCQVAVA